MDAKHGDIAADVRPGQAAGRFGTQAAWNSGAVIGGVAWHADAEREDTGMRWLISFVAGLVTAAIAAVIGVTMAQNAGPVRLGFFGVSLDGSVGELVLAAAVLGFVAALCVLLPELAWSGRRTAAARTAVQETEARLAALQKEQAALRAEQAAMQAEHKALQQEHARLVSEHARLQEEHARVRSAMVMAVAPRIARTDPTDMGEQGQGYEEPREWLGQRIGGPRVGGPRDGMRQFFEA